jgi:HPt (histidine-containing phosphotransfer) domain-containing protein
MSSGPDPSIDAALAAMRAQFAAALPEKAAHVDGLLAGAAWGDARRAAHRLRGSAGTHGFAQFGAVAAAIEELLLAEPGEPCDETRGRLRRLSGQLLAEAGLAAAERP